VFCSDLFELSVDTLDSLSECLYRGSALWAYIRTLEYVVAGAAFGGMFLLLCASLLPGPFVSVEGPNDRIIHKPVFSDYIGVVEYQAIVLPDFYS